MSVVRTQTLQQDDWIVLDGEVVQVEDVILADEAGWFWLIVWGQPGRKVHREDEFDRLSRAACDPAVAATLAERLMGR